MTSMIPYEDEPFASSVVSKTSLGPKESSDSPGVWRRFWDAVLPVIGLKSVSLSVRYAEAKVAQQETENEIKLLRARIELEQVQAEIRRLELKAKAESEVKAAVAQKTLADAEKTNSEARKTKAEARIAEVVARQLQHRNLTNDDRAALVKSLIRKIEQGGGSVHIEGFSADDVGSEPDKD